MKTIPLLATLLTVAFVVMKLDGHLAWSWWLVWCPLWAWYGFRVALYFLWVGVAAWIWKYGNALDRIKLLQQGYVPKEKQ